MQDDKAIGRRLSGSLGFGTDWMSCLFHILGLFCSVCYLFICLSNARSPAGPSILTIVYVILSAPGAVSLPVL